MTSSYKATLPPHPRHSSTIPGTETVPLPLLVPLFHATFTFPYSLSICLWSFFPPKLPLFLSPFFFFLAEAFSVYAPKMTSFLPLQAVPWRPGGGVVDSLACNYAPRHPSAQTSGTFAAVCMPPFFFFFLNSQKKCSSCSLIFGSK